MLRILRFIAFFQRKEKIRKKKSSTAAQMELSLNEAQEAEAADLPRSSASPVDIGEDWSTMKTGKLSRIALKRGIDEDTLDDMEREEIIKWLEDDSKWMSASPEAPGTGVSVRGRGPSIVVPENKSIAKLNQGAR